MTACQGSIHTHMAGGQDIPAQAPRDLIPLVSLGAVASSHAAQAQKHRLNLRSPASPCHLPSAKRYFTLLSLIPLSFMVVLCNNKDQGEVILCRSYRWWRVEEEALGGVSVV